MKWFYYIPHTWGDGRGNILEKVCWEDLYLMPDVPGITESIWLTVDGYYPEKTKVNGMDWGPTWFENDEEKGVFLKQGFLIRDDMNMIVKDPEFTKGELIEWAKFFIREIGYPCDTLEEAPLEHFAGSNQHACAVERASEILKKLEENPEAHSISLNELKEKLRKPC